ncbi:MAG: hypothetical protein AB1627_07460 [Chloroflexota bacterium]
MGAVTWVKDLIARILKPIIDWYWRRRVRQPLKGCVHLLADAPTSVQPVSASAGNAHYEDPNVAYLAVQVPVLKMVSCAAPANARQFNLYLAYPALGANGGAKASRSGIKVSPSALGGIDWFVVTAGGHRWVNGSLTAGEWTETSLWGSPCGGSLGQGDDW